VIVTIVDDGIGIDRHQLKNIFKAFMQTHVDQKKAGGLGLGLALANNIARLHGGNIIAKSDEVGKGSEFSVRLPVAEHVRHRRDEVPHRESPKTLHDKKVIVVDDNRPAADKLTQLLKINGYEARAVYSGESAIDAAKEDWPDTVLLDIGLPRMDGYEVGLELRKLSNGNGKKLRIIGVSGYGQEQDLKKSNEAGFDYHLVKPAPIGSIKELIERE
jgi:CheY-like chemotaxis protein